MASSSAAKTLSPKPQQLSGLTARMQAARQLLAENRTPTAALVGRYVATYNHIRKRSWWDGTMSGGTIVEQATHFVDMMRYLGGEIDRTSIQAIAVGPDYPLAEMPQHPEGEHLVRPRPGRRLGNQAYSWFRPVGLQ